MRILTVSDFIERSLDQKIEENALPKIDLILSCGDIAPEYLVFLKEKLLCPLYYIKGNHDIRYDGYSPEGCTDIHRQLIQFKSLRILGLEGSMLYSGKENQYSEKEMKKILRSMWFTLFKSKGVDIVITHAPPRHIHDADDLCHQGFKCFIDFIQKYSPKYFIHGHIHKNFNNPLDRVTVYGRTKIINTSGYNIIEY
ncbi:MAG: metallophosphoesterase [Desulfobacteraceae bacterium]|nr:metallophosphoesterase [Desulfobacteraceae bacterium]